MPFSDSHHTSSMTTHYTYSFTVDAPVRHVFPLLDPKRENEWVPGWEAYTTIIHSTSGFGELGAVFRTQPEGSEPVTWVITEYEYDTRVAFAMFQESMVTRLTIRLADRGQQTLVEWEQHRVAVTDEGRDLVASQTDEDYAERTAGIAYLLRHYLSNGTMGARP